MFVSLILIALNFATFADELPEGWGKLSAPGMGFAVTLPKDFKKQKVTDKDPNDKEVKITLYRASLNDVNYIVGISEFSKEYLSQPKKVIYDNARDGSIARSGGKLVRESDIKLGKHEGREVVTAAGKKAGFVRARIFVANDRQYAVMVAAKTEPALDTDDARRFLDSFRITAVKKAK